MESTSPAIYKKILGALLVLTVVTVLAAGVNFGAGNVVIALAIASVKASLVALYFMHLRHNKPMSAIILLSGVAMLGVFLMFSILDTDARVRVRPSRAAFATVPAAAAAPAQAPVR